MQYGTVPGDILWGSNSEFNSYAFGEFDPHPISIMGGPLGLNLLRESL